MIFEKLLFFVILIYILICGIEFLMGKTPTISNGLYKLILGGNIKSIGFYRKAVGISLICLAIFGLVIILLSSLHGGLTKTDHIFVNICFVIEAIDVIYLNKIRYEYIAKK